MTKTFCFRSALLLLAIHAAPAQVASIGPSLQVSRAQLGETYVSPNVECHQGYAWDGAHHYTIDTAAIYKHATDAAWTIVASNTAPFAGLTGITHMGDGDYYNGQLYIVAERWIACGSFFNQSILIFDAATLAQTDIFSVAADNHEVSGLAVVPSDGTNGVIYVTSYCDGSQIWEYDLLTHALLGTIPLSVNIPYIQGVTWHNGVFYISQDTGNIYSMDYSGNITPRYTSTLAGSHEGLKFVKGQIRLLIDHGTGFKSIHYITLGGLSVTCPTPVAGWILESSSSLSGAWTPVEVGLRTSNTLDVSTLVSMGPQAGCMFFRLRQPSAAAASPD